MEKMNSKSDGQDQEENVDPMQEYRHFVFGAVKKAFSLLFHDGEVQINVDNIVPLLKAMEINPNEDDILDLIRTSYIESAGVIDPKELDDIIVRLRREKEEEDEAINRAFELIDSDCDGVVTGADINQLLTNLGMMLTSEELATMLENVDSDGDGRFDLEDFRKFILRLSTETNDDEDKVVEDEEDGEKVETLNEQSEPDPVQTPSQTWTPEAATKQRRMAMCFGYVDRIKRTESKFHIQVPNRMKSEEKNDNNLNDPPGNTDSGQTHKAGLSISEENDETISKIKPASDEGENDLGNILIEERNKIIGKIFEIQEDEACGRLATKRSSFESDSFCDKTLKEIENKQSDSSKRKKSVSNISSDDTLNDSNDGEMEVDEPLIVPVVAQVSDRQVMGPLLQKLITEKYSDKENRADNLKQSITDSKLDKSDRGNAVVSKGRPKTAPSSRKVVSEEQKAAKLKRIRFLERAILQRSNTMSAIDMVRPKSAKCVSNNTDHVTRRISGIDNMTGYIVQHHESKHGSKTNSLTKRISVIDVSKSFNDEKAYKESAKSNIVHRGCKSIVPLSRVLTGFLSTNNKTSKPVPATIAGNYSSVSRQMEMNNYPLKKSDGDITTDKVYERKRRGSIKRSKSVVNLKIPNNATLTTKPKKVSSLSRLVY